MTRVGALTQVEDMFTGLGLKDLWGQPVIGIVASGPVAEFHGEIWKQLEDGFFISSSVSPEEYVRLAGEMIREFKQALILRRARRRLTELGLDQRELDLVPGKGFLNG